MRRTPFALLSAALLLILPAIGNAQQGGATSPAKPPASRPQTAGQPPLIPLDGRYLAARVAEQDHDYDAAADQIDLALAQTPDDPELLYSAFRLRIYAGRIDAAAQLAPQVLATRPGDGFANLVLAVQAIKKGDYRAAEQQIDRIGAENQLGPLREYVLAWLKAGEKEFPAARAQLAKLKPATGERAEAPALVIEAQIDEMAGDKAAAEAKYRRAISLDPSGLRTTVAVAEGLRRLDHGSGLRHRPATAIVDELAVTPSDSYSLALWNAHVARTLAAARTFKAGWPSPRVATRDPYALRGLVLIACIATFVAAGGERWKRIAAAFDWQG
ncbi:MAG TPA: DUF4175 family protein, partial [Reyranella sp.]|nr:DUF4175 family protein [Reyranella sp.]